MSIEAMLLNHEQQIKDIAAHLLELRAWGTPMMEFKREQPTKIVGPNLVGALNAAGFYQKREWQSLTDEEIEVMVAYLKLKVKQRDWHGVADAAMDIREMEAREKKNA